MSEYVPNDALAVRVEVGEPGYTPDLFNAVRISLTVDSSEPGGAQYLGGDGFGISALEVPTPQIRLSKVYMPILGFGGEVLPKPTITLMRAYIRVSGRVYVLFGGAAIKNALLSAHSQGFVSSSVNKPAVAYYRRFVSVPTVGKPISVSTTLTVTNFTREIYAGAGSAFSAGKGTIRDRAYYPQPAGLYATLFGATAVELEHRTYRVSGFDSVRVSTPGVRLGRRFIAPAWIYGYRSGYAWLSDGIRYVEGVAATNHEAVVAARIWIADRTLVRAMRGFDSATLGQYAEVFDPLRVIAVRNGAYEENLQRPEIYNKINMLTPALFEPGAQGVTSYGQLHIRLADAYISVEGFLLLRFGLGTQIYYFVGDVDRVSLGITERFGALLIAPGRREIVPESRDYSFVAVTAHVRNLGLGLSAKSWTSGVVANPYLEHGSRSYKIPTITTAEDLLQVGFNAAISFGQRRITEASARSRGSSYVGVDANVSNRMRFVTPASVYPPTVVRFDTEVVSRFNIIKQFHTALWKTSFGDATILLYDREIHPAQWAPKEDSIATVAHKDRPIYVSLGDVTLFGPLRIRDALQEVNLFNKGFAPPAVEKKHAIKNLEQDPPSLQKVFAKGHWVFDPDNNNARQQVGSPIVGVQVIYDVTLGNRAAFGIHEVFANTIIMDVGIWNNMVGAPVISPAYIWAKSIPDAEEANGSSAVAVPFINPYHIFGPLGSEAPDKYRPFVLEGDTHVVDGRKYRDDYAGSGNHNTTKVGTAWVPRPRVTHWVQVVLAGNLSSLRVGTLDIRFPGPLKGSPQYIKMKGFLSLRVGWLHFPPDLLMPESMVLLRMGSVKVAHKVDYKLRPQGLSNGARGRPTVDYYNRYVAAKSWVSDLYGRAWAADRIRYLAAESVVSKGALGDPSIAYKIRRITPPGDVFLNPASPYIGNPTTVRNQYQGRVLSAKSVVPYAVGEHAIGQRTQHAAPRSMFYVPLFPPTVKGRTEIQALGAEHTEFGHVRKYEDGAVYPHEFGPAGFGRAFVVPTREMQGFDSAVVEYPVIAKHVGAYGTPGEQFGVTVFTNEVCCEGCG